MVKINLLAEGRRPIIARKAKQPLLQLSGANAANIVMYAALGLSIVAALVWFLVLQNRIHHKDEEIRVAQKEVDELRQVIQEVQTYEKQLKELRHKVDVITRLKNNQRGPVQIMDAVSRALPDLLWLSRMDVFAANVNIQGSAFNTSAIANFIDNLDKVPTFREPILQDATRAAVRGPSEVYNFRLTFGYSVQPADEPKADDSTPASAPGGPGAGRGAGGE